MSFEVTGKLVAVYPIVQRSETFKTREFVIEKQDDFAGRTITNYIKFQCVQDKTLLPEKFNKGDEVKVYFNLKGSKWMKDGKENYITNLDAWRMEQTGFGGSQQQSERYSGNTATQQDEDPDDLPF